MTQATVFIYKGDDGFYYWEAKPGSPCTVPFMDRVSAWQHAKYCFRNDSFVVCTGRPLRLATKATRTTGREM